MVDHNLFALIKRLDELDERRQFGKAQKPRPTEGQKHANEAFKDILAGSWGIIREALEEKAKR